MEKYYTNTYDKVARMMGVDTSKGLSGYECMLRKEQYGDNKIFINKKIGIKKLFNSIHNELYILLIIGITITSYLLGQVYLAKIGLLSLIANLIIKIVMYIKSQKSNSVLNNINETEVTVLRESREIIVKAQELVKGDVVILKPDSLVAADIRLVESTGLIVDEKSLTGENILKEKFVTKLNDKVEDIQDISNMVFRGSQVKVGTAVGIVINIGLETELGKSMLTSRRGDSDDVKLEVTVEKEIIKALFYSLLFATILQLIIPGTISVKLNIVYQWIVGSSIVFIPIIYFFYRRFLINYFKNEGINIKSIKSILLADKTKILFLNKIGSVTKDELIVKKVYANDSVYTSKDIAEKSSDMTIKRILEIGLLSNNSKVIEESVVKEGDLWETAYVNLAKSIKLYKNKLEGINRRIFVVLKNSSKQIITTVNKSSRGYRANSRGRIDDMIRSATHILVNGVERPLNTVEINKLKRADMLFAQEGLVTEVLGYRSFKYKPSENENVESNIVIVGIVACENPLIEGIESIVRKSIEEGTLPIIFTEENKIYSEVLGRKIGLVKSETQVMSGIELEFISKKEFSKSILKSRVLCNVSPKIKGKIIKVFNDEGIHISYEGEKISDIPMLQGSTLPLCKDSAINIVKKSSMLISKVPTLKAFQIVKEYKNNIYKQMKNAINLYINLILSEIVVATFYYFITEKSLFPVEFFLITNCLLVIPFLLIKLQSNEIPDNKEQFIIRNISFFIQGIISIFIVTKGYVISYYLMLGMNLFIHIIINSIEKINKDNIFKIISGITLYLIGITHFVKIVGEVISYDKIGIIVLLQIIFVFVELILRKWKESTV